MEEHVPSDKMTAGDACGVDRFCRFAIRVQKGEHGGTALIPPHLVMGWCGEKACAVGREWKSMRRLTKWLPAARARLTGFAVPSIGCSGAGGAERFCRFVIRVQKAKGFG